MLKHFASVLVLAVLLMCSACAGLAPIKPADVETAPTASAKVIAAPNPLLMGHWRRIPPAGINNPWAFNYWLVKKGEKYAVYYYYDSHKKNAFKGWAEFTIDGDRMTSGVDGVIFYVENGEVLMQYPGRSENYKMMRVE
ncbi:hypothetical protein [Fundidesulfovibrio soli]|uniref:hypothetical protein n=1 Tax=Fundidesulfovibrio soli TaxID=2922716 RepID=UPI001FAF4BD3|nr:hypothetical protein [Fundidesulfovibrio soli]